MVRKRRKHLVGTKLTTSEAVVYRRALALTRLSSAEFLRQAIEVFLKEGNFPLQELQAPATPEELEQLQE